ncbi:uncharacterized protein MONOS_7446 [Monocercomonoides exilis]|uniref:uncharacterized protein n=1 Tax=Monocercomonoides exilis TaxID=2049356 RepID=UPI00355A55E4|nr:hypothetical protein MONOS_7446 [Monocercomonoides exilis]|eukprot:MONOS_7446.1-p1 / transcript=MONOS_7446.1 / gene=MONOS_7446 / organism=Monocercomonoides_exilis_PA203 / gene_product=unspecified product / transcript_product=unspecified product / location=Mono_scaffold00254:68943-69963(+) / protein_length=299 / sequence_SO=supercontig / SO=protein_coding / is_pseudo=false
MATADEYIIPLQILQLFQENDLLLNCISETTEAARFDHAYAHLMKLQANLIALGSFVDFTVMGDEPILEDTALVIQRGDIGWMGPSTIGNWLDNPDEDTIEKIRQMQPTKNPQAILYESTWPMSTTRELFIMLSPSENATFPFRQISFDESGSLQPSLAPPHSQLATQNPEPSMAMLQARKDASLQSSYGRPIANQESYGSQPALADGFYLYNPKKKGPTSLSSAPSIYTSDDAPPTPPSPATFLRTLPPMIHFPTANEKDQFIAKVISSLTELKIPFKTSKDKQPSEEGNEKETKRS